MNLLRWLRGLLPTRKPRGAAQPVPPASRVMHLAIAFAPACGLMRDPLNFITIELPHVTCQGCRTIAWRMEIRRRTRLR